MGRIFNIKNFNAYTGRYSRSKENPPRRRAIAWEPEDLDHEVLPVLAIRNREAECATPLAWRTNRNIRIAVEATLASLSAWQAYRPYSAETLCELLREAVPRVLERFQRRMLAHNATSIDKAVNNIATYWHVVLAMADAVGSLSALKNDQPNPMLGSKIMHFLLPEFFPVWDTAWVNNKALQQEEKAMRGLGDWMPPSVEATLSPRPYAEGAIKYARYVALMMKDLDDTGLTEYRAIEKAFILRSRAHKQVVWHHFHDLTPLLFEVCLLGKHSSY